MTMNKKEMKNYPLMHVSTVLALTIALVTSTFAFPMVAQKLDAPYEPNHPGPEDGSIDISVSAYLNWTGGDPDGDPVTYDVYFGNLSPPPKVVANQSITYFDPFDMEPMEYSTVYYWLIIAWDNHSTSTQGPEWQFTTKANEPPFAPSNPYPAEGSIDIPATAVLNWTGGDPDGNQVTVTYDVYFGTTSPPPKIIANQSDTTYDPPGTMNYTTPYYWMIVAWDDQNASTSGPEWNFTTGVKPNSPPDKPSNADPADMDTNVPRDVILSWVSVDPDGDVVTYDVYFGPTVSPPIVESGQSENTYDPIGLLDYGKKYYWKIVAWDTNHSVSTSGDVWSFTTVSGTPISVAIIKPVEGKFYLQDQERFGWIGNKTFVYGPITIQAEAISDSSVAYVEFYVDGKLKANVTTAPYEYTWNPIIQFNGVSLTHTIKVVAYDSQGHNASDEINVTKWRFHILPWVIAGVAIAASLVLHTKITGWVFNLQESRFSCSFYVFSAFYKTKGPFRSARGVIKMKAVTGGKIIGPTSLTKFGLFHKLAFGSFTFIGIPHYNTGGLGQGLFRNLLQARMSSDTGGRLANLLGR